MQTALIPERRMPEHRGKQQLIVDKHPVLSIQCWTPLRGSQDKPTLLLPLHSVLFSKAALLHQQPAPVPPPWGLSCCPWTPPCSPWQPQGAGLILILGSTWILQHHRGTGEIHPPSSFPLSRDVISQSETLIQRAR